MWRWRLFSSPPSPLPRTLGVRTLGINGTCTNMLTIAPPRSSPSRRRPQLRGAPEWARHAQCRPFESPRAASRRSAAATGGGPSVAMGARRAVIGCCLPSLEGVGFGPVFSNKLSRLRDEPLSHTPCVGPDHGMSLTAPLAGVAFRPTTSQPRPVSSPVHCHSWPVPRASPAPSVPAPAPASSRHARPPPAFFHRRGRALHAR